MKLDLRAFRQETLDITLLDENETTVHVLFPTKGMYEKLLAMRNEIAGIASTKDTAVLSKCYDLMAEILSRNLENLTITGEELHEAYGIDIMLLIQIANAYIAFTKKATEEKNF